MAVHSTRSTRYLRQLLILTLSTAVAVASGFTGGSAAAASSAASPAAASARAFAAAAGTTTSNAAALNAAAPVATRSVLSVSPVTRPFGALARATAVVRTAQNHAPKGTALFVLDGGGFARIPLDAAGRATVLVPQARVGRHALAVRYLPAAGSSFVSSLARKAFDVVKNSPSVTVRRSTTVVYGAPMLISTSWRSQVPVQGTVRVLGGSTVLAAGQLNRRGDISFRMNANWTPGVKRLVVQYMGSGHVNQAARAFEFRVQRAGSRVSVSVPSTAGYQQRATARVSVSAGPATATGSVTVNIDGIARMTARLSGGQASVSMPSLSPGRHSVTASYAGDARYLPSRSGTDYITAASSRCSVSASACIDLTNQLTWLQSNGRITYGPVPITSGMPGWRTPAGSFSVFWKHKDHYSSTFNNAPMPNSVFFNGGIAFHAGSLYDPSHGCIHLSYSASEVYFNTLEVGDEVYVWGYAPY